MRGAQIANPVELQKCRVRTTASSSIVYTDGSFKEGDLVGFTPSSTYEFIIDGKRLYRVMTQFITIKYEYQGNEEEYNPSWA